MVTDETLDVLVIGSSPLLLVEALRLQRAGRRVTVAEQLDRFGGAWHTSPLWEFESVELACHYIDLGRHGYAFLRDELGIELQPHSLEGVWINADEPPPEASGLPSAARWLMRKALWARFLSDDTWGLIKSFRRRDLFKFGRILRRKVFLPPYVYPVGGAKAIVDALVRKVGDTSIELMSEARIHEVLLGGPGRPTRCLINGRRYSAKTVVLGQHVYPRLPLAGAPGRNVDDRFEINVILRITGAKAVPFEYVEVHGNDLVQRVADVSAFAHPRIAETKAGADTIICCHMTHPGSREATVDPAMVFSHLMELGFLAPGGELRDSHVERYPTPLTTSIESTDAVSVIRTFDLGIGLERLAKQWRRRN